eukprot:3340843-Prymnesium_polylepis.1
MAIGTCVDTHVGPHDARQNNSKPTVTHTAPLQTFDRLRGPSAAVVEHLRFLACSMAGATGAASATGAAGAAGSESRSP